MIEKCETKTTKNTSQLYHKNYETIRKLVSIDLPVMLVGPAGSGKNICVQQVADSLNLHMYYANNVSNEFKITGFIDAGGRYNETEFYRAFKNGGLFFLDEIDSSDPSALITLNAAISNGYFAFPHETINRHPNFRIVAAANTWGHGMDFQYVGRNTLDSASLDRFVTIEFDYDRDLEKKLIESTIALTFIWVARESAAKNHIRHVFSTRAIVYFDKMLKTGFDLNRVVNSVLLKGMSKEDIEIMKKDLLDNKQIFNAFNSVKSVRQ